MKTIIVLAVHGAPARDFPRVDLTEFFSLHARLEHSTSHSPAIEARYAELAEKMRMFPRHPGNDPFLFASKSLATALSRKTGLEVLVGCNEFCAPTLDEALSQAASYGAERVMVVTPMLTRGGEHAEVDIAKAIESAGSRHHGVKFIYAWPFAEDEIASFLAEQVGKFQTE